MISGVVGEKRGVVLRELPRGEFFILLNTFRFSFLTLGKVLVLKISSKPEASDVSSRPEGTRPKVSLNEIIDYN